MAFVNLHGAVALDALAQTSAWPQPQILGYHHPAFQNLLTPLLNDELRCLAAKHPGGGLCGVLPYRIGKSRAGHVINAFPFFGCNGLVATCPEDRAVEMGLLAAFRAATREKDVLSAALYTPFLKDCASWRTALEPDEVVIKFTQHLDIAVSQVWPAKRAADLRRALRRGFEVRRAGPPDNAAILDLYRENCLSAGIPMKPPRFISDTLAMSAQLGDASPMRWLAATLRGKIVAALLYGRGSVTGSYILPCADANERQHQPNALLMDTAIRREALTGLRHWNFESSPAWDDAVFKFKARWGAQTDPFAVMVFYRNGLRPAAETVAAMREDLPYYFVAPAGRVSGTWPEDAPLPDVFTDFRSSPEP